MKINNWIVPALVIAGIALIFVSLWGPQNRFQLNSEQKYLAHIIEKSGNVTLQNNEMSAETGLSLKSKLNELDIIRTDSQSEVLVEFKNGGQLRMSEKTEILLDVLDNTNPLVVVRSGEVFVEKFGEDSSFWIRSDGQQYSAADFVLIDKKNGLQPQETNSQKTQREQVTQVEIETMLNTKKTDFFKCFGQLIQKKPQSEGQVLISFTIETNGKLSHVELSRSDISDTQFKSCLTEVVSRIRFRAFSGNPVTTVFPLKFE